MAGLKTPVTVEVMLPNSPFGSAQITNPDQSVQQIEINTGSPVNQVFGRIGSIVADCGDYAACYAPIGAGLPRGGVIGQTLTKASNNDYDIVWGNLGAGTVTTFSAGNLAPLFTSNVATPASTPALTFALINAGAHQFFGNNTAAPAAPAFFQPAFSDLSGTLSAAQFPALTGDVTTPGGSFVTTISTNAVTYAKMQQTSAASVVLGRGSASGAGNVQELTMGTNMQVSGTTLAILLPSGNTNLLYNNAGAIGIITAASFVTGILSLKASTSAGLNVVDNTDNTKKLNYNLTAIPTATTRTMVIPGGGNFSPVIDDSGASHNFLTSIVTGAISKARPVITDLTNLSTTSLLIGSNASSAAVAEIILGTNLSMSGNTLNAASSGGNVSNSGTPIAGQVAVWVDATHVQGVLPLTTGYLDRTADFQFTHGQSITQTLSFTNIATPLLALSTDTSGTPANGLGTGIQFSAQSSTTADRLQAQLLTAWSDVTDATRTAYMDFLLVNSAAAVASKMRLFPSGGLSVNSTTDPGTGYINASAGFKIGGTDLLSVSAAFTNKDLTGAGNTFPTLNQNTTGSAAKWTTARNLAGNSVDGSANVAFANAFIVQGTADAGLSGAQFLGALGTGIVKNTTTTGVLSIAVAGDFPTLNQNTTGSAAKLTTARSIYGNSFDGTADLAQIIGSAFGGTGNGFTKFSGPTTAEKTKTLRDASDTILELGGSYTPTGTWTSLTMVTPVLGTPTSGNLANCTFPTLNQNTTGSAASLSISGQTGLLTFTGLASTNRAKTIRDAADTLLELGGSYTPTGTWTSLTMVTPVLGTPASGNLANCTFPTLNQNTTGSAASLSISGQTGLLTFAGLTSTNRAKTVRDAADTILELAGSYTPTGTWTSMTFVTPALGTPASGVATNLTGTADGLTAGDVTRNHPVYASGSPPTVDVGQFVIAKTGVDLHAAATTAGFTVPAGRTFVAVKAVAVVTAGTGLTTGALTYQLKESAASKAMTQGTASTTTAPFVGACYPSDAAPAAAPFSSCAAGNVVNIVVGSGQASTTLTATVFITGYYSA